MSAAELSKDDRLEKQNKLHSNFPLFRMLHIAL